MKHSWPYLISKPVETDILFAADLEAEQASALMRLLISVSLCVLLGLIAIFAAGRINSWIVTVCLVNLALAITGVWLTRKQIFRTWFPIVICAADALVVFSVGVLGPWLHVLPSGSAFALVSQWAVFLILAIETLRARVETILLQTTLICALLCTLVWKLFDAQQPTPSHELSELFSDPANLTRVAIVLFTGLVLAYGAHRSRRSLKRAISEMRERALLQRFHPDELRNRITAAEINLLRQGRRHQVCILVADLRNFTSMAENLPPEKVAVFLNSFRARTEKIIQQHGGTIDKFVGDGLLAVFGLTNPGPGDAGNTLAAGKALLQEIARWSQKREREGRPAISVGIGLHCGEVFVGVVGNDRMEFTVIGDAVNVAHRLEAMTRATGCALLASQDVLVSAAIEPEQHTGWHSFPDLAVKGREGGVNAFGLKVSHTSAMASA